MPTGFTPAPSSGGLPSQWTIDEPDGIDASGDMLLTTDAAGVLVVDDDGADASAITMGTGSNYPFLSGDSVAGGGFYLEAQPDGDTQLLLWNAIDTTTIDLRAVASLNRITADFLAHPDAGIAMMVDSDDDDAEIILYDGLGNEIRVEIGAVLADALVSAQSSTGARAMIRADANDNAQVELSFDGLGEPEIVMAIEGADGDVYLQIMESPTAVDAGPGTNTVRLYALDNGAGKTQLYARFPTGAPVLLAIEP